MIISELIDWLSTQEDWRRSKDYFESPNKRIRIGSADFLKGRIFIAKPSGSNYDNRSTYDETSIKSEHDCAIELNTENKIIVLGDFLAVKYK